MSITFTAEIEATAFDITDGEGGRERHATRESADVRMAELAQAREPLPGCTDPEIVRAYGAYLVEDVHDGQEVPWVSATSVNARHLLRLLGLLPGLGADDVVAAGDPDPGQRPAANEDDLWGRETSEQFLGRTLLALAAPASAGVPAYAARPRTVDCGRRSDYDERQIGQLHGLAKWAQAHGASHITWG